MAARATGMALVGLTLLSLPIADAFMAAAAPRGVSAVAGPRRAEAAVAPSQRQARSNNTSGWSSFGSITGAAALAAVLGAARQQRRQRRQNSSAGSSVARQAEEIEMGYKDPITKKKNYVNPWEAWQVDENGQKIKGTGWRWHEYTGPVYKQVPVVEGISFPLDPTKYYAPLEPPPPGAKWGDGRDIDGNWYMKGKDDEKIQFWQGVGRRKCACAIVRIVKGQGQFIVNGRDAIEYFQNYPMWWLKACEPIAALSQKNNFDILAKAFGSGNSSQAGAIRLGLARAMQEYNYSWRPLLKKSKYLTRDWRMSEPKKTGQPKARKKTPYHKR